MENFKSFSDHEMAEQSKRVLMCNKLERRKYEETCQRMARANVKQIRAYDAEMSDIRKELYRFTQAKRSMRPNDETDVTALEPGHETSLTSGRSPSTSTNSKGSPRSKTGHKRHPANRAKHDPKGGPVEKQQHAENEHGTSVLSGEPSSDNSVEKLSLPSLGPVVPTEESIISAVAHSNNSVFSSPPDIEIPSYIKPKHLGRIDEMDEGREVEGIDDLPPPMIPRMDSRTPGNQVALERGVEWLSNQMRQRDLQTGDIASWRPNLVDVVTALSSTDDGKTDPHTGITQTRCSAGTLPPITRGNPPSDIHQERPLFVDNIMAYSRHQERTARADRYRVNTSALHYLGEGTFYGLDDETESGSSSPRRRRSEFGQGRHVTVRIEKKRLQRGESSLNRKPLITN